MVAVHPRLTVPGQRQTVKEHLPPEARAYLMRDPQWCLKQAQRIGPSCHALIEALFSDRVLDNLRAAQGIVGFSKRFGTKRLEAACCRALFYDNPRYRTVKSILDKGLDQIDEQTVLDLSQTPLSAAYTGEGRFCRDTRTFFNYPNGRTAS